MTNLIVVVSRCSQWLVLQWHAFSRMLCKAQLWISMITIYFCNINIVVYFLKKQYYFVAEALI